MTQLSNLNGSAALVAVSCAVIASSAGSCFAQAVNEGFDWLPSNTSWYQNTSRTYTLESGTWTSWCGYRGFCYSPAALSAGDAWRYVAPQAGTGAAILETPPGYANYLMSPVLSMQNGWQISFWAKARQDGSPEQLRLMLSTSGTSTSAASFTTELRNIGWGSTDPAQFDSTWRQYTATINGLGGPINGRFAFVYDSPMGNGIAIDTVSYNVAPAPGAFALIGLASLAPRRRRAR